MLSGKLSTATVTFIKVSICFFKCFSFVLNVLISLSKHSFLFQNKEWDGGINRVLSFFLIFAK